jgi:hypothetical protein
MRKHQPPQKKDTWGLASADRALSMHPSRERAKLAALFHVNNGDTITWEDRHLPLDVASDIGVVNGRDRFVVYRY